MLAAKGRVYAASAGMRGRTAPVAAGGGARAAVGGIRSPGSGAPGGSGGGSGAGPAAPTRRAAPAVRRAPRPPRAAPAGAPPLDRALAAVSNLFPLWTLAGSAVALWRPETLAWFSGRYVVYALGATMLAMGITLSVRDFRDVARNPWGVAVGASLQYSVMPLLGFAASRLFPGMDPMVAAGVVVVACCPGGTAR